MPTHMNPILFSIITVVFNGENEIEQTLLSCIEQNFQNIEYIVIDGASTDNTLNIVNKYRNRISKIISEPDKGIYDAMNKGISIANGEWLLFMNCGDQFFNSSVLSNVASELTTISNNPEIIYGDAIYKYQNTSLLTKPMPIIKINREMIMCHQSIFVRKDIIKANKFDLKYKLAADYAMMYKLYFDNYKFQYLNLCISINNQVDGETMRNFKLSTKERYSIHKDHGSLRNLLLLNLKLVRMQIGIQIKQMIPDSLSNCIFKIKYCNRIAK